MTEAIAAQGTPLFVARQSAIAQAGRVPQALSAATGAENAMQSEKMKWKETILLIRSLISLMKRIYAWLRPHPLHMHWARVLQRAAVEVAFGQLTPFIRSQVVQAQVVPCCVCNFVLGTNTLCNLHFNAPLGVSLQNDNFTLSLACNSYSMRKQTRR